MNRSLCPTGCIPWIILRFCCFLYVRDAGLRGSKITVLTALLWDYLTGVNPSLYHGVIISEQLRSFVPSLYLESVLLIRAQLFEGRLALNPGLNLARVSFSFVQENFLRQFSLIFIEHRIINLLTKRMKLNLLYKLSYLNSNFALTLGYLNPALNNPALACNSFSEPHTFAFWWCPIQGPCLKNNVQLNLFSLACLMQW